uniref:Uncharacterized protein n=1 Tax=Schlesneria paludicola TaxID=360056 RepID=A0A7C2K2E3_9PLAN
MTRARKLTFQLTPLLDLLLIVIFAQYLDVRSTARRETIELEASRTLISAQLDEALRQLIALREKLAQMEQRVEVAETRSVEADRFLAQRDLIGELVTELFRLPEGTLAPLLQSRTASGPGPSASDLAQLQSRLKALGGGQSDRVVDHLLTFGEMRKRMDVWELYLQDNGSVVLTVGDKRLTFRAESADAFATRLFEAYKTLPEPKSLVLLLVSYGDAKFQSLKAMLDGLPQALDRIRTDAGDRSRLDYAVLGFRPKKS